MTLFELNSYHDLLVYQLKSIEDYLNALDFHKDEKDLGVKRNIEQFTYDTRRKLKHLLHTIEYKYRLKMSDILLNNKKENKG